MQTIRTDAYRMARVSAAHGAERVSAWSPVRPGAPPVLARVDGVLLLEGAAGSPTLDPATTTEQTR